MYRIDKLKSLHFILLFLALVLLSLVALHPFLMGSIPLSDDGSIHIYRSIVLDYSIRHEGVFYPRYSPALVYGYGAPLFNYFPPTAYYPTVLLHSLGLSWLAAWKSTMIFYIFIAAWGAYLLARQWTNEIGGFIAAAAFIYSPYALFDAITRGTSTEFAGLAFLPFALWAFTRLANYGRRSDFILSVLTYALFILLHNVMTLYGSLLLVLYCGFLLITANDKKRAFWQMLLAGILAVLMSAFFWWPALAETNLVKINGVAENLSFIDVRNTLRSLSDVFALPHTADPTQLQAAIPVTFAWPQLKLAILGLLIILKKKNRRILLLQTLLFVVISIIVFSQLEISADVWQSIAILRYSQFAWRTMSIGTLALALLAGIGASFILDYFRQQSIKIALFSLFLAIIILSAIPWLYRPAIKLQAESVADAIQYEIDTGELALSSYSEYLPVLTDESTLEPTHLLPYFKDDLAVPRLQANEAITVMGSRWSGTSATLSLEASKATKLVFDWLYFDGWQATVDGELVEVYPFGDAAFVALDIGAGHHDINIALKDTTTQQQAVFSSRIAILAFLLFTIFVPFKKNTVGTTSMSSAEEGSSSLTSVNEQKSNLTQGQHHPIQTLKSPSPLGERDLGGEVRFNTILKITVALLGIALFLTKIAIIDQTNNPFRTERFANGLENGVENVLNADFNDEIRLLGSSSINNTKSGKMAEIRLFWTLADGKLLSDYSSLLELRDSQDIVIAKTGSFYIGGLATSEWLSDYYLEERLQLKIPPATPPGDYRLDIALYDSQTGQRLNVLNTDGNPIGVEASVSTLTVLKADKALSTDNAPIASNKNLSLLEINGIPEQAQVGDEIIAEWLFQMEAISEEAMQAKLVWLTSDNQVVAETQSVDIVNDYPTTNWQAGDAWNGYHRFYVPGNLEAGQYTVAIQFGDSIAPIAEMHITVPERNYTIPDIENASDAKWQNGISLLGYEQTENSITLFWQSDTVLNNNLRLFVQVLDSANQVIAINDSIPVNWTRPTTSWDIDEVITTQHNFGELAASDYYLLIGWYNPLTGNRILLDTSDDALRIQN